MRVSFSDIPVQQQKTYTFVSSILVSEIKFCLERDCIPYVCYGRRHFDEVLPPDMEIPEVLTLPIPGATRICRTPAVFVTNLNTDEFTRRIEQIARREDDELEHLREIRAGQMLKTYWESYSDLTGIPVSTMSDM